jgi:transcriptional regulator with XRE-family HTH domain
MPEQTPHPVDGDGSDAQRRDRELLRELLDMMVERRKELGLSVQQVATRMGVSSRAAQGVDDAHPALEASRIQSYARAIGLQVVFAWRVADDAPPTQV